MCSRETTIKTRIATFYTTAIAQSSWVVAFAFLVFLLDMFLWSHWLTVNSYIQKVKVCNTTKVSAVIVFFTISNIYILIFLCCVTKAMLLHNLFTMCVPQSYMHFRQKVNTCRRVFNQEHFLKISSFPHCVRTNVNLTPTIRPSCMQPLSLMLHTHSSPSNLFNQGRLWECRPLVQLGEYTRSRDATLGRWKSRKSRGDFSYV